MRQRRSCTVGTTQHTPVNVWPCSYRSALYVTLYIDVVLLLSSVSVLSQPRSTYAANHNFTPNQSELYPLQTSARNHYRRHELHACNGAQLILPLLMLLSFVSCSADAVKIMLSLQKQQTNYRVSSGRNLAQRHVSSLLQVGDFGGGLVSAMSEPCIPISAVA